MEEHVGTIERVIIERVKNLANLYEQYDIDAYLVPSTDEYLSEYSPAYYKRLQFITGFGGSNGYGLIHPEKIYFFTDGRYITQAGYEIPQDFSKIYEIKNIDNQLSAFKTYRIGYNPKLFCKSQLDIFSSFDLVEVEDDLVDRIWLKDRPEKLNGKAFLYEKDYSGEDRNSKISNLQKKISEFHADYHLITDTTSICWLLNIRGSDVPFCPLLLSVAVISKDKVYLFTDLSKINHLAFGDNIILSEESGIYDFLSKLDGSILVDKNKTPISYLNSIKHLDIIYNHDLCCFPKACKNDVEIEGAKKAHIKDAISLIEFFSWLEESLKLGETLTEFDIAKKLTHFRSRQEGYISDSFPSICGFKDNGAIIHYRPHENSAKTIEGEGLLLIDSGGHYDGGTTDVTRTINIGSPKKEYIKFYTKVLKGHIRLFNIVFPEGASGSNLDILARQYLWEDGVDYAHGTGHGVGNMLSVHEGPHSLNMVNNVPLKKNMIISNEPGYYVKGEFGIRIENLMYVKSSEHKGFLKFENLTMLPYCNDLIDISMLDLLERKYLIKFYDNITSSIKMFLSDSAKKYLQNQIDAVLRRLN